MKETKLNESPFISPTEVNEKGLQGEGFRYKGWLIDKIVFRLSDKTTEGYVICSNKHYIPINFGEYKGEKIPLPLRCHTEEGGIANFDTLEEAKEYIDNYLVPEKGEERLIGKDIHYFLKPQEDKAEEEIEIVDDEINEAIDEDELMKKGLFGGGVQYKGFTIDCHPDRLIPADMTQEEKDKFYAETGELYTLYAPGKYTWNINGTKKIPVFLYCYWNNDDQMISFKSLEAAKLFIDTYIIPGKGKEKIVDDHVEFRAEDNRPKDEFEEEINEAYLDRKTLDEYRTEISRLSHSQPVIQENGRFHIYNVKENEVDSILRRLQGLDYIERVSKFASGNYNFNNYMPGRLPERYWTIDGIIKIED